MAAGWTTGTPTRQKCSPDEHENFVRGSVCACVCGPKVTAVGYFAIISWVRTVTSHTPAAPQPACGGPVLWGSSLRFHSPMLPPLVLTTTLMHEYTPFTKQQGNKIRIPAYQHWLTATLRLALRHHCCCQFSSQISEVCLSSCRNRPLGTLT